MSEGTSDPTTEKTLASLRFFWSVLCVFSCAGCTPSINGSLSMSSVAMVSLVVSFDPVLAARDRTYLYSRASLFPTIPLRKKTETALSVTVTDQSGKPIEGATVAFQTSAPHAQLLQPTSVTNPFGKATGSVSFGDGGNYNVDILVNNKLEKTIQIKVLADDCFGNRCNGLRGFNNGSYSITPSTGTLYRMIKVGSNYYATSYYGNRVLIFDDLSGPSSQAKDALFQKSLFDGYANWDPEGKRSVFNPRGIATRDSNTIVISDSGNSRILVYFTAPTSYASVPDLVLGQADFVSLLANRGGVASKGTLNLPVDLAFGQDGQLAVADKSNNRVLIWNSLSASTGNGGAADLVLGQTSSSGTAANSGGSTAKNLNTPTSVAFYGNKMIVSDLGNNRVKIYSPIPTTDNEAPVAVLGQPDFNTVSSGCSSVKMNNPSGVAVTPDGKLIVTEYNNSRVLIYNSIPSDNSGAPYAADIVLGQPNFTTCGTYVPGDDAATALKIQYPTDVSVVDDKLIVSNIMSDINYVWNSIPTVSSTLFDFTWGNPDQGPQYADGNGAIDQNTIGNPFPIQLIDDRIVFPSNYLARIQITDKNNPFALENTIVLGQPDIYHAYYNRGGSTARNSLNFPRSIAWDGARMYVADSGNNRVLIYNSLPTQTDQLPDLVLGQPNFNSGVANYVTGGPNGTPKAYNMNGPNSILVAQNKLFVSDYGNKRVLIWNTLPTTDMQPADVVLGQSTLQNNSTLAASSTSIQGPRGIAYSNGKLLVYDSSAPRILVFNSVPTDMSGAPYAANTVIGQANFTSTGAGATASRFNITPSYTGMNVVDGMIFVDDAKQYRVLVFNQIPSQNGASADWVIGQDDFMATSFISPTKPVPGYDQGLFNGLARMYNIVADDDYYYIADMMYVVKLVK